MIPLALHSAMLDKLNKLGGRKSDYSQQWLIETLIKEWIAGDRKIESKPPPRYQDDLDNLGLIMESGTPSQKRTIHGLLKDY